MFIDWKIHCQGVMIPMWIDRFSAIINKIFADF